MTALACHSAAPQPRVLRESIDPTRTITLRRAFVADAKRRFNALARVIRVSIVDNDCFGLNDDAPTAITGLSRGGLTMVSNRAPTPAGPKAFDFNRTASKVDAFMAWLDEQEDAGILEITRRPGSIRGFEQAWTDVYIQSAYQKGIVSARAKLRRAGADVPTFEPGDSQAISAAMNGPAHADRAALAYTRTFNELKGIDNAMDQQISGVLAQGLIDGKRGPELASVIVDRVHKIGRTRAVILARTEITRAHHMATIQEYRQAGIEGVQVEAEWSTAGDSRVCPICRQLDGAIMSLDEAEGLIPRHPQCIAGNSFVFANNPTAIMSSIYSGPIVKVTLSNGASLSVTPKHMLLTEYGLVQARFLCNGDNLTYCGGLNGVIPGDPNDYRNPSRIDNIVKSLSESHGVSSGSMPVSAKNFHGDGKLCKGDINIIRADGLLGYYLDPTIRKNFNRDTFDSGSIANALFFACSITKLFERSLFATDRFVCASRESLSLIRGCLLHPEKHCITSVSCLDPNFVEPEYYATSGAAKLLGDFLNGVISKEQIFNLIMVDVNSAVRDNFPKRKAVFDKPSLDSIPLGNADSPGDTRKRFSPHIGFVKIKNIETFHAVDLPVFDVSTLETGYIVNGILSSNCRCSTIPYLGEEYSGRTRRGFQNVSRAHSGGNNNENQ